MACVLIEPIQGEGGFVVPAPGFLPALAAWARERGVPCSWPTRSRPGSAGPGDWFACEHEAVVPDLITTAKALAGGMPLAAVTGRAELMDGVHAGGLGGTYGGNPVACAAALAAIATMEDGGPGRGRPVASGRPSAPPLPALQADPARRRRRARTGGDDGHGAGPSRNLEPDAEATRRIVAACHRAGVVVLSCGSYGNVIRLLPPLVIDDALLADGLDVLAGGPSTDVPEPPAADPVRSGRAPARRPGRLSGAGGAARPGPRPDRRRAARSRARRRG